METILRAIRRYRLAALCAACIALVIGGCRGPGAVAPVTVARLSALQVTGGERMYPAFDPGVLHYAVRCADGTALQVAAEAEAEDATLRLLHDDSTGTGSVAGSATVNSDHDLAIEVGDGKSTATYYVHCIPLDFPDITIGKRTDAVSDGLLLITPQIIEPARIRAGMSPSVITFLAIVDNNGVPRWVRRSEFGARDFRRHADGRYSHSEWDAQGQGSVAILDAEFNRIDTARTVGNVTRTIGHEFLVTEEGNYLLLSYNPAQRDLSGYQCKDAGATESRDCTTMEQTRDSVIQEVTPDGVAEFMWNSWDHLNISDCGIYFDLPMNYAVINSLHLLDGDIVASFRGCNQVLRIERPSGAVVWQMGGMPPTRDPATEYLEVIGDPAGEEFCGQHTATATGAGSVLMFDNGYKCRGPRKEDPPFTRVVEYDISSGTEARFVREYRLPDEYGYVTLAGGVMALANGHWLVGWGLGRDGGTEEIAVSEVDTAGNEIFRMAMSRGGEEFFSYRVYRERESDVNTPVHLP